MATSTGGIKTSFWGPHAWAFLFSMIAGSYPVRVNPSNSDHTKMVRAHVAILKSLRYTLPCRLCRESYSRFLRELPIEKYTRSRRDMLYWLYLIHDKVNQKLMKQEQDAYELEKAKLKSRKLPPARMQATLAKIKARTLKTKPSPPFDYVIAMYDKHRACA